MTYYSRLSDSAAAAPSPPVKSGRRCPLQIFNYAISPYDEWHRLAWAGALVLIVMIMVAVTLVRLYAARGMMKGTS